VRANDRAGPDGAPPTNPTDVRTRAANSEESGSIENAAGTGGRRGLVRAHREPSQSYLTYDHVTTPTEQICHLEF